MPLTVILPAHNPSPDRLERVLAALAAQSLSRAEWEIVLVDNASSPALTPDLLLLPGLPSARLIVEPTPGLSAARLAGFAAARGDCAVLVDDDNVLAPDYLAQVVAIFARDAHVGAAGGRIAAEFATQPAHWTREFHPLLALRDLGDTPQVTCEWHRADDGTASYPLFAPVGAGMALRRAAWAAWIAAQQEPERTRLSDRRGSELSSAGDNDIVLCALGAGWQVGYFPQLRLTHLIPATRLTPDYLARLNRGIQRSWMQVLTLHRANPWPPLSPLGATLRKAKAWLLGHPWSSKAARVRWAGNCGHFDGRVRSAP